jgi:hypothetical protein
MALVPLAVAATAFACARLATLKLDRDGARAGATVNAIGRNFNSTPTSSTVKVRFNSRNGDVLWEGRPDAKGKFTGAFTVPEKAPGYYVIVATQEVASGAPAAGTPGRHSLRIRGGGSSSTVVAAPVTGSPGGGPSAPAVLGVTTALLGLLGAGAWSVATLRRSRRRGLPVLGRAS